MHYPLEMKDGHVQATDSAFTETNKKKKHWNCCAGRVIYADPKRARCLYKFNGERSRHGADWAAWVEYGPNDEPVVTSGLETTEQVISDKGLPFVWGLDATHPVLYRCRSERWRDKVVVLLDSGGYYRDPCPFLESVHLLPDELLQSTVCSELKKVDSKKNSDSDTSESDDSDDVAMLDVSGQWEHPPPPALDRPRRARSDRSSSSLESSADGRLALRLQVGKKQQYYTGPRWQMQVGPYCIEMPLEECVLYSGLQLPIPSSSLARVFLRHNKSSSSSPSSPLSSYTEEKEEEEGKRVIMSKTEVNRQLGKRLVSHLGSEFAWTAPTTHCLYLDGPRLRTTQMLKNLGLRGTSLHIPNPFEFEALRQSAARQYKNNTDDDDAPPRIYPAAVGAMLEENSDDAKTKMKTKSNIGKGNHEGSFYLPFQFVFLDYCSTFKGSKETQVYPRKDVELAFQRRIFAPRSVLALTISLRGCSSVRTQNEIESTVQAASREAGYSCKQVWDQTYRRNQTSGAAMYVVAWELARIIAST